MGQGWGQCAQLPRPHFELSTYHTTHTYTRTTPHAQLLTGSDRLQHLLRQDQPLKRFLRLDNSTHLLLVVTKGGNFSQGRKGGWHRVSRVRARCLAPPPGPRKVARPGLGPLVGLAPSPLRFAGPGHSELPLPHSQSLQIWTRKGGSERGSGVKMRRGRAGIPPSSCEALQDWRAPPTRDTGLQPGAAPLRGLAPAALLCPQ